MPIVLQLQDAYKRYGEQALLDGADCALPDDQKVGLIGRNGAGKSTLCRILLGDEELDAGEVVRSRKLRLGYLRQHDPFHEGETVLDFLMRDSGQPDWRCGEVAWQFQLPDAMLHIPVRSLSGGWQTRVKLAALLLHDPNLLILDEPTNFLDLRTQMLLEEFLRNFDGGCLVVSHDRAFLKRTCPHTLELSRGKLEMFPGDVDAYLANLARAPRARPARELCHSRQAQAARNVHRQESRQRQHRQPGPQQGQAAREAHHDRSRRRRGHRAFQLSQGRAAARHGAAHGGPGHRLSRSRGGPRRAGGDRARLARGRGGRQRPGQNHFLAHDLRLARPAGRPPEVGLRLPDGRLRPARVHHAAGRTHGGGLPLPPVGAGHEGPADQGRGWELSVHAAR